MPTFETIQVKAKDLEPGDIVVTLDATRYDELRLVRSSAPVKHRNMTTVCYSDSSGAFGRLRVDYNHDHEIAVVADPTAIEQFVRIHLEDVREDLAELNEYAALLLRIILKRGFGVPFLWGFQAHIYLHTQPINAPLSNIRTEPIRIQVDRYPSGCTSVPLLVGLITETKCR